MPWWRPVRSANAVQGLPWRPDWIRRSWQWGLEREWSRVLAGCSVSSAPRRSVPPSLAGLSLSFLPEPSIRPLVSTLAACSPLPVRAPWARGSRFELDGWSRFWLRERLAWASSSALAVRLRSLLRPRPVRASPAETACASDGCPRERRVPTPMTSGGQARRVPDVAARPRRQPGQDDAGSVHANGRSRLTHPQSGGGWIVPLRVRQLLAANGAWNTSQQRTGELTSEAAIDLGPRAGDRRRPNHSRSRVARRSA